MKNINIKLFILAFLTFSIGACESYLERAPESQIGEKDVFSNFESYEGFEEQMYDDDVDLSYIKGWQLDFNLSEHAYVNGSTWYNAKVSDKGVFRQFNEGSKYIGGSNSMWSSKGYNIYDNSWNGIRIANQSLAKLDKLKNATQAERNLLKGQAYFFRGYFHWRIAKYYGGIPYVDKYLEPSSNLDLPRLNWQSDADHIVKDLDKAIKLLPYDWSETAVGQQLAGTAKGRATKGAAMGYKAKVLLYAGSPLMNKFSGSDSTSGLMGNGGSATYDHAYLKRAAKAAWKVMKISEEFGGNRYGLVSWKNYHKNFWNMDGEFPYTKEILWNNNGIEYPGVTWRFKVLLNEWMPASMGVSETEPIAVSPTQNLVDQFESSNGYPIDDSRSNYDPSNPWQNRDPRFDYNILVDGEHFGTSPKAVPDLYKGGTARKTGGTTGYLATKYWPPGANKWDNEWSNGVWNYPNLRLADIYLIYAEAANEVYGPQAHPDFDNDAPSAVEAVNKVRERATHVDVPSPLASSKSKLRDVIRNERAVELCLEKSDHWQDIRRWYVADQEKYKKEYKMNYDKQHTYFDKELIDERVFTSKHYWVPFPEKTTNIYSGWSQNPGW